MIGDNIKEIRKSKDMKSVELAEKIDKTFISNSNITFIIGGSYGLHDDIKKISSNHIFCPIYINKSSIIPDITPTTYSIPKIVKFFSVFACKFLLCMLKWKK